MASNPITRGLDQAERWTQRWMFTRIGTLFLLAMCTAWAIAFVGTHKGAWSPVVMIAATVTMVAFMWLCSLRRIWRSMRWKPEAHEHRS